MKSLRAAVNFHAFIVPAWKGTRQSSECRSGGEWGGAPDGWCGDVIGALRGGRGDGGYQQRARRALFRLRDSGMIATYKLQSSRLPQEFDRPVCIVLLQQTKKEEERCNCHSSVSILDKSTALILIRTVDR